MDIPISTPPLHVTATDLAFYYPKIAKAVGHNKALFPYPVLTRKELNANSRLVVPLKDAMQELATRILKGTVSCGMPPSVARAEQLLRGFAQWLDGTAFQYAQGGKVANGTEQMASAAKREKYHQQFSIAGTAYNIFASVKSPIGNCEQATSALAYLFIFNGFRLDELQLCKIGDDRGVIFFKGENHIRCFKVPSAKCTLVPVYRFSTAGGTLKHSQLSTADCDQPFGNHWVLKWRGKIYDTLYRCSYTTPSEAFHFARASEPTSVTIPPHSAQMGTIEGVMADEEAKKVFFGFSCDKLSKAVGAAGKLVVKYAMFDISDGGGSIRLRQRTAGRAPVFVRNMVTASLPLSAGRVFGWCVPDDDRAAKKLLMTAVIAYENTLNIFRVASDGSRIFCRLARKWCGEAKTAPKNRIYSSMTQTEWDACQLWTGDDARDAIYDAMYAQATAGTTLRKSLWEAFEVPSIFRA